MQEKEIWKPIMIKEDRDFNGLYSVSNLGRVKRLGRYVKSWNKTKSFLPEKIVNQFKDKYGYKQVSLTSNGKNICRKVHRLVAASFIGSPKNNEVVNHIDENKANNNLKNLEWVSNKRNLKYSLNQQHAAEAHKKPVIVTDEFGNSALFKSITEAEKFIGLDIKKCSPNISKVLNNPTRIAYGFRWKTIDDELIRKLKLTNVGELEKQ